jgi:hypothetical protein
LIPIFGWVVKNVKVWDLLCAPLLNGSQAFNIGFSVLGCGETMFTIVEHYRVRRGC